MFTKSKHPNLVNMKAPEIWKKAMDTLPREIANKFSKPRFFMGSDEERGLINFSFNNKGVEYKLYTPGIMSHADAFFYSDVAKFYSTQDRRVFLITPHIYPKIAEKLMTDGINYLDASGNMYINYNDIYILKTGKKTEQEKVQKSRLFSESGVKLLFGILQSPEFLDLNFRRMGAAVGISASSVSILLSEMESAGYLYEGNKKKRVIGNRPELIQRWVKAYNEVLKPKLFLGSFSSKKIPLKTEFKNVKPLSFGAEWSGEPAANLYTNYLSPEKFSLFVKEDSKQWRNALSLLPEKNGILSVYRYFWDTGHEVFYNQKQIENAVPPLIVYAELTGTGDSRNLETAKIIFDEYL